jgi:hypothetical protein
MRPSTARRSTATTARRRRGVRRVEPQGRGVVSRARPSRPNSRVFTGQDAPSLDPARTPGGSRAVGRRRGRGHGAARTRHADHRLYHDGPLSSAACLAYRPTWGDLRTRGVMESAGSLDARHTRALGSKTLRCIATCCWDRAQAVVDLARRV